jgi:hypothetical protein
MHIEFAHLRDQGIDFAVSNANAASGGDVARRNLLAQLTAAARSTGLNVDKSALAFRDGGHIRFFGTPDLVTYLASRGVPRWTHTLNI